MPFGAIDSRYRRLLELGRGGTARVYLAKSRQGLRKLVVLKTLQPELSVNTDMRELFRREAEICARLNHPNIVQVHEVIEEESGPVIVMEYLEGIALSQAVIKSEGRIDKRLYLHAITQLLAGLHYFHELRDYDRISPLNAIHRDVSPQNVILLYEGAVKVLDFGIAKLSTGAQETRTGVVKGKLHYMPAEQLMSDGAIDRRADLYAAGVMLWEALAGRRMWHGQSENTVMRALIAGKVPLLQEIAPDYPKYFYEIVSRATAFEPGSRYPTALEMQLDVEQLLVDLGGPVHARELSEFMRVEFGEHRHEREAAIEAAVKQSLAPVAMVSSSETLSLRHRAPPKPSLSHSDVITASALPKRRRRLLLIAGLVSALGGLVVAGVWAKTRTRTPFAVAVTPRPVAAAPVIRLNVSSNPTHAFIALNGKTLGTTPWSGEFPSNAANATLELKADGYEPAIRTVSLAEDLSVEIQLQPVHSVDSSPSESSGPKKTLKRSKTLSVATKSSAPANSPSAPNAPNCTPPYTLGADGIRTYKAECFGDSKQR